MNHLVTTPIFYINSRPHIGHFYTVLLSDAVKRSLKISGISKNIFLSTGTDEHGLKVLKAVSQLSIKNFIICLFINS